MIWAMGYATKAGLIIRSDAGDKRKIRSLPVGNMHAPDAEHLKSEFFDSLTREDVVISPAGPNYTYLVGAYGACGNLYWIDPGTLAKVVENGLKGKPVVQILHELWKSSPQSFYRYEPTDARVAALRLATLNWLSIERQATGDGNAYSQLLKRERDFKVFTDPPKDVWVKDSVKREKRKLLDRNRKAGVILTDEQKTVMERELTLHSADLYDRFFGANAKEAKEAQKEIVRERLEWFGVEELRDDCEKRVITLLKDLPENRLFDGLVGEGAIKTRAEILSFVRNPLFYPSFPALASYAGVGKFVDGQAARRKRGERQHGVPEFKRALCFDFADKYANNDPIGFFRSLYYAYKGHQYYTYWPLMELTTELWASFGNKKPSDEETDEVEKIADEDAANADTDRLTSIVDRLTRLSHLPLVGANAHAQQEIAELHAERNPDPKRVWKLFSKGEGGLNIQMTPARVEKQAKRYLGTILLQAVYYRWLASLGKPLPLAQDTFYVRQWRKLESRTDGVPETYDHEVPLMYFQFLNEELKGQTELPADVAAKLIPPKERLKPMTFTASTE